MTHWSLSLSAIAAAALMLSACVPRVTTVTVTVPPETVVVTATPVPTAVPSPSPSPPPSGPKVLDICLVGEPDTLYLYGGSELPATRHVMEAVYDGPIDRRDYGHQPVILEKLPSLADGDAVTRTTYVRRGDRVVDADGDVVELDEGVRVRPSGCYTTGCEVTFESGLVRMERLEVTFALRQDVTWSDGEPVTAEDSVFAFEVASDPATPGFRRVAERTASYKATDQWQTRWVGLPGFRDASYALRFYPPLPRHELEGRAPAELPDYEGTRRKPLGWGPFIVDAWLPGERITLSRNPNYFRSEEGLPYVDQVVFHFKTDGPEMAAGLLSGMCDIAAHDADYSPLLPLLRRLEEEGTLQVVSAPGPEVVLMSFLVRPHDEVAHATFFSEAEVRQALSQCVDRQVLMEELTLGRSLIPDSYLPPAHPLYPKEELAHWRYDPGAGRATLDQLGWRDADGDGVREAHDIEGISDGRPLDVVLLVSAGVEGSEETARILRAQLADCGVRVRVDVRSPWDLVADAEEGPLMSRQFDLAAVWSAAGHNPGCGRYMSPEVEREAGADSGSTTGYSDPVYDEMCLAAQRALPGTGDYERYHQQAQLIFSQDVPALPLFVPLRVALTRPGVRGLEMDATSPSELWSLESVDLDGDALLP